MALVEKFHFQLVPKGPLRCRQRPGAPGSLWQEAWLNRWQAQSGAGSAGDSEAIRAHRALWLCPAWPTVHVIGGSGPRSWGTEDAWQGEPCARDEQDQAQVLGIRRTEVGQANARSEGSCLGPFACLCFTSGPGAWMEHMWRGQERGQGCTGLGSPPTSGLLDLSGSPLSCSPSLEPPARDPMLADASVFAGGFSTPDSWLAACCTPGRPSVPGGPLACRWRSC